MVKKRVLSDTAAIAAKPVMKTCNPDYSGFRNSTPTAPDGFYLAAGPVPFGGSVSCGNESLRHAKQVLEARMPGGRK